MHKKNPKYSKLLCNLNKIHEISASKRWYEIMFSIVQVHELRRGRTTQGQACHSSFVGTALC